MMTVITKVIIIVALMRFIITANYLIKIGIIYNNDDVDGQERRY